MAGALTGCSVGVRTFDVTRSASFNVLHLVISSIRGTIRMLHTRGFTIVLASIMYVDYPGITNSLTGILSCLTTRGVFVRCVCTFTRKSATRIIVHPSGIREYIRVLGGFGYGILAGGDLW